MYFRLNYRKMTDVEVNVSTKRKSFSNKQGKKDSPKKFKLEATKTPQKGKALDKNVTPKQQNRPQNNNSGQKPNTKNKRNSESGSPKKIKTICWYF
ncbi:hypothetical protein NQ314_003570 [Rhamnusium bicolor]|uniref:Uncharacterized protein n=1 Tax=Rhamnusium bicolor TaxID=1586634 RepID=A0AAV8ZLT4_9CUCU|nr:hypothetical protein NQ314_003570 [Rhamnusium bicolor]